MLGNAYIAPSTSWQETFVILLRASVTMCALLLRDEKSADLSELYYSTVAEEAFNRVGGLHMSSVMH